MFKKLKDKFRFKAQVPELKEFIGRTVYIPGKKEPVKINSICGNIGLTLGRDVDVAPTFYEINGEHLIGMLRFHAQMEGSTDFTEEDFKAFEETSFHAEKLQEKSIIEVPNGKSKTN